MLSNLFRFVKPKYTKVLGFLAAWRLRVNETLELKKHPSNKGKERAFVLSHPIWLHIVDNIRTIIQLQNAAYLHPGFKSNGLEL